MFPRHGFLSESQSAPNLGPGIDGPTSPRFDPKQYRLGCGPEGYYDLPPVETYKSVQAAATARLGPGLGKPVGPRIDPNFFGHSGGADTFYDPPLQRSGTAPSLGPGFGRPSSPRSCDLAPPGSGADQVYSLPDVAVYKQPRDVGTVRWDPKRPRFDKTRKPLCGVYYTLPEHKVYMKTGSAQSTRLGPGLGKPSGERIDGRQYKGGNGADALYTLPSFAVYKPSKISAAHRFAAPEVRPKDKPFPVRMPSPQKPTWVDRLGTYTPRARRPWLEQPLAKRQ